MKYFTHICAHVMRKEGLRFSKKNIPQDVYDIIIDKQGAIKKKQKITQFSLEQTVYSLIRAAKNLEVA